MPELESPPSIPSLYGRAALGAMLRRGGGSELPAVELSLGGVALEPDRVADYARVCGFTVRNTVPGTFPHILAFPLQLKLMTGKGFPFPVLGLVHIANRIDVLGDLPSGAQLDFKVHAEDLRDHPRGRQLDLVAEAMLDGEPVWRGRSKYLKIERSANGEEAAEGSATEDDGPELEPAGEWKLPGDLGRRYGAVSGDRNPIHMSALSAKAFGFPTAIAHGMWTKAHALASFEGKLPDTYRIEIEFRSPLRIPGKAQFRSGRNGDGWAFAVESPDGERSHATGSITPAGST